MKTHAVLLIPEMQCVECSSKMIFLRQHPPKQPPFTAVAHCGHCDVDVKVLLDVQQCEIVASKPEQ